MRAYEQQLACECSLFTLCGSLYISIHMHESIIGRRLT